MYSFGDRQGGEPRWPEYFFLPALLLVFITVLNDGTMIAIGYDNAKASARPAKVRAPSSAREATLPVALPACACTRSCARSASCTTARALQRVRADTTDLFSRSHTSAVHRNKQLL